MLANPFRTLVQHDGTEVTVTIGKSEDGVSVEDDGPGIPEGERDTVLESGYTVGSGGSVLGLSIVGQIAGDHKWELSLTEGESGEPA